MELCLSEAHLGVVNASTARIERLATFLCAIRTSLLCYSAALVFVSGFTVKLFLGLVNFPRV